MGDLFLKILNMSIAASWLILAVVLLRFLLKKAPKWIVILLWGIVALRLVVPFSFESALSLIPSAETFNAHNIQYETPAIHSGIPAVNHAVNPVLGETFAPNPAGSVNPLYVWTFIVSVIWLIGIAAMLLYAVISYVRVRRSVAERVPYEGNIFLCDHVKSPFILGLVRPKIYLPSGMDATAMGPVIAHEKAHLARRDHWWKPLGFLILTVHWFNPLCWIAYVLLCRDIELACDEKVIRQMDLDGKKQYSTALLECSTGRRLVTICPLAFGEIGVKERVKNVLNYKKPAFWIIVLAVVACAVVTVCFATNPPYANEEDEVGEAAPSSLASFSYETDRMLYDDDFEVKTSGFANTEICPIDGQEAAVEQAKKECTIEYNSSSQYYDSESEMWRVDFQTISREQGLVTLVGTRQSVYLDSDGITHLIVYHNESVSTGSTEGADTPTTVGPDAVATTLSEEQTAIRLAIMEHNKSSYSQEYDMACCSFIPLETLSGTPLAGSNTHKITYYGWALYDEYRVTDSGLKTVSGSHIPVVLSFDLDERGYTLTEYWEPGDGSYYAQDIREKFPAHIVEDGLDSQKFILQQTQECYAQAIASTGLDTEKVIGSLIETICSSPAQSSSWWNYIEEHPIEYRELTRYGQYTLKYCFTEFLKGGQTGLCGHIMRAAMDDIAPEAQIKFDAETGQEYFDAWKDAAISVGEQRDMEWIETHQPAIYLLLSMLGEV